MRTALGPAFATFLEGPSIAQMMLNPDDSREEVKSKGNRSSGSGGQRRGRGFTKAADVEVAPQFKRTKHGRHAQP